MPLIIFPFQNYVIVLSNSILYLCFFFQIIGVAEDLLFMFYFFQIIGGVATMKVVWLYCFYAGLHI
jgi:hypothetical protein